MKVHQRHVYLLYVYDLPSHQQQITHVWKATTTYLSLTITELWDSVTRAQEINQFTTPQQTRKHLPVLDDVIEQWIPVQYEESQNAEDMVLRELLQTEFITEWPHDLATAKWLP